ncbi:MAG: hypothetical protein RLZZ458_2596, partial [Planctomycetota bacterium]
RPASVVLKFLPSERRQDPSAGRAFQEEFNQVWRLRHPAICSLLEFGTDPHFGCFQVMFWLPGRDLRKLLRAAGRQRLPVAEVLQIVRVVADVLDHVHQENVVHGDIKPENVMLDPLSGKLSVIDFGVPKGWCGTQCYLSPERRGQKPAAAGCDRWSLSVMAWELLTGQLPRVPGEESTDTLCCVPEMAWIVPIFQRAFATLPDERYRSARQFSDELSQAAADAGQVDTGMRDVSLRGFGQQYVQAPGDGVHLSSLPTRQQPMILRNRRLVPGVSTLTLLFVLVMMCAGQWTASQPAVSRVVTGGDRNSVGMWFNRIPGGKFRYSLTVPNDGQPEARSGMLPDPVVYTIRISGFEIGVTEVTQQEWIEVMQTRPWRDFPADYRIADSPQAAAVGMTWEQACEFCCRLSQRENRHYRLPTEAEWEFACRVGIESRFPVAASPDAQQAPPELKYHAVYWEEDSSGEDLDEQGVRERNFEEIRADDLQVASRRPNGYGLFDMLGCAQEMCLDEFVAQDEKFFRAAFTVGATTQVDVVDDPVIGNPAGGEASGISLRDLPCGRQLSWSPRTTRVIRGGGYDSHWQNVSHEERGGILQLGIGEEKNTYNFVGFRVVRAPVSDSESANSEN